MNGPDGPQAVEQFDNQAPHELSRVITRPLVVRLLSFSMAYCAHRC